MELRREAGYSGGGVDVCLHPNEFSYNLSMAVHTGRVKRREPALHVQSIIQQLEI